MLAVISYIVPAKSLKPGQRIIEARFGRGNQRVEKSYEVLGVRVGRFATFTIADEAGVSLRTFDPDTPVELVGPEFSGEAYKAEQK